MIEGLAGGLVWALANFVYVDLKRKGKSGFSRIVLFWMGLPLTWLWLFLIREGSAPEVGAAPDDADAILAEIRRERQVRSGAGGPDDRPPELEPPARGSNRPLNPR